jgi:hypothetical protein
VVSHVSYKAPLHDDPLAAAVSVGHGRDDGQPEADKQSWPRTTGLSVAALTACSNALPTDTSGVTMSARMSVPPSAATPDDTRPSGLAPPADSQERASSDGTMGGNAVGVLTALGFMAFLVAYALFGQRAAGIAFWAVLLGLPALLVVVSALGAAWRRNRGDELLEVATLAVRLAAQRRAEDGGETAASMRPDVARGPVDDLPESPDV